MTAVKLIAREEWRMLARNRSGAGPCRELILQRLPQRT